MWTSLKNTETNKLVRVKIETLEKACQIAKAIAEENTDEAREQMVALTETLAAEKGEPFRQKLGLARWSVRVAQDFIAGNLVAIDEDEAREIETQDALADLMG